MKLRIPEELDKVRRPAGKQGGGHGVVKVGLTGAGGQGLPQTVEDRQ